MSGRALPPSPSSRATRTLRCRTVSDGGARHHNHIRDLPPLLVEEGPGLRSGPQVPTPPEALLAALGSCLSARIHANAQAGSVVLARLELQLEMDVGASALWEPSGSDLPSPGFETIRIGVHIEADASREAVHTLVSHAVMWSPVANTLHDPVRLDVQLLSAA